MLVGEGWLYTTVAGSHRILELKMGMQMIDEGGLRACGVHPE